MKIGRKEFLLGLLFHSIAIAQNNEALSDLGTARRANPSSTEQELIDAGCQRVRSGDTVFYIGYRQTSADNQDPILFRFDNGVLTYSNSSIETTGDDGRGYGLLWDGKERLYAIFSCTGNQSGVRYSNWTGGGWEPNPFGTLISTSGSRIIVILKIDPASGIPQTGTYLWATLSSGRANTITGTDLRFNGDDILLVADSFFSPVDPDKNIIPVSGSSPHNYHAVFSADLSTMKSAAVLPQAERQLPVPVSAPILQDSLGELIGREGFAPTIIPLDDLIQDSVSVDSAIDWEIISNSSPAAVATMISGTRQLSLSYTSPGESVITLRATDESGLTMDHTFRVATVQPEIPLELIVSPTASESSLTLSRYLFTNRRYQLQKSSTLRPNSWTNQGEPIAGSGSLYQTIVSRSDTDRKFWRMVSVNSN